MNTYTYIIVVVGILLAKSLGFVRNIVFASSFGATELTDIYFQIFSIPTFIFTGVGTALATIVIKDLNKKENKKEEDSKKYVSKFICTISIIVIAITFLMYVFTGPIVKLLLPGMDQTFYLDACRMMYIMLPSALFIVVAYIISGVLQNNKVFFITSIMSLPYNIVIIFALFFKNVDIFTICWITTLGWFLHIVILIPSFYKKGFRLFYKSNISINLFNKKTNLEVLYIFISSMMLHMCFMIDKASVSYEAGAATTINYASNFFVMIASIFVVAMSNVSFPNICKNYENKDKEKLKKTMVQLNTILLAIVVPFIMISVIFGTDIIKLFYERDNFTSILTSETAILFIIYTFSILGYICQELFNKILYLGNRYKIPFLGSIIVICLKPIINLYISDYGSIAVALSTTILSAIYGVVVLIELKKITGNFFNKELLLNFSKIFCASTLALAGYFVVKTFQLNYPTNKFSFLIPFFVFVFIYFLVVYLNGLYKKILQKEQEEETYET